MPVVHLTTTHHFPAAIQSLLQLLSSQKTFKLLTFQSFIGNMINDLYTTLTITYYTICTLIRSKEDRSVGRGQSFFYKYIVGH